MRGLGSEYTLILIDGKRQNTTRGFIQNGLGNQTSFMPPPSMIEKIEVIRGPASIIYGSDAMGGVINIITKKHTDKLASGIQLESKLFEPDSEWGNAYGANAYINTPLIKDKLSLNLRASGRFNEANKFLKPSWVSPSSNGNPYAAHSSTGSRNFMGGFRLNYTPTSRDYIYLDSEVYNGRLGSLNTSSRSITSIQELFKVNSVLSHEGDYAWGKLSSYVQHSFNLIAPHANVPIGGSSGEYINWASERIAQSAIAQSTYTHNFDLKDYGVITFNGGVFYQYENLLGTISSKWRNMHQNQAAAFAEGKYLISQYISTTLGLRFNYSDRFSSSLNPRFYVNYNPTRWLTFKTGVASGMQIPGTNQTCDGGTCSTYRNIERSLVTGLEFGAKIKPIYGISLDANYSFTYTQALSGSGKGEPINSIPRHSFTLTPKYQWRDLSVYVRWSGKFETPTPYAGSNARTNV